VEIEEALKIVRALADGVDPHTGQVCPGDAMVRNPQVVIALHRAIGAMEALAEREQARQSQPANANRWWSKTEDQQVCEELRQGLDFKEIAKKHHRTVPSIVARLIKLGKIAPKSSAPLFAEKAAS
jgi:DNA-binding NarL/FixJ family response regulator